MSLVRILPRTARLHNAFGSLLVVLTLDRLSSLIVMVLLVDPIRAVGSGLVANLIRLYVWLRTLGPGAPLASVVNVREKDLPVVAGLLLTDRSVVMRFPTRVVIILGRRVTKLAW